MYKVMLVCHFYQLIISKTLLKKSQFVAIFPTLKLRLVIKLDQTVSGWLVVGNKFATIAQQVGKWFQEVPRYLLTPVVARRL